MIKPKIISDENLIIMRKQIGIATHQFNGEKIDISQSLNGMSIIIGYKDKSIIWNIREMAEKSIELIDGVDSGEE